MTASLMIRTLSPLAAITLLCLSAGQTVLAQSPSALTLPIPLSVGKSVVLLQVQASGVQIYTCKVKPYVNSDPSRRAKALDGSTPQAYEWVFKAPEADLSGSDGSKLGRHYAGPTWEATDGSKVVGSLLGSAASPGNIPWLLLAAKSNTGKGRFSKVTYVERVFTLGGAAPKSGADAAHVGTEIRVPYTATYIFYAIP